LVCPLNLVSIPETACHKFNDHFARDHATPLNQIDHSPDFLDRAFFRDRVLTFVSMSSELWNEMHAVARDPPSIRLVEWILLVISRGKGIMTIQR
jgi:hypothetical protein